MTGHPEKWAKEFELEIKGSTGSVLEKCKLGTISSNPADVIPQAGIVFICLPGPYIRSMLEKIKPFLDKKALVGSVVSNTGFFFQAHDVINGQPLFGFQRVPFISRIVDYGKRACLLGFKKSLCLCVENYNGESVRQLMEDLLNTPIKLLHNFYEVSLSNSNPLLHPARMYSMWKDWTPDISYDRNPAFYAEWTDEASRLLIDMDHELQLLLLKLPVDPSNVPNILDYYESVDAPSLTRKIRSIPAFQEIMSPMKKIESGKFIPDLDSRYFTEDFECGTFYIRDSAIQYGVPTPTIDLICKWYETIKTKRNS